MAATQHFCVTLFVSIFCILDSAAGQEVRFHWRPTRVNDSSRQIIHCDLSAERAIRQQNQLIDSSKQQILRQQERTLVVLDVQNGKPRRANITYRQSATEILQAKHEPIKVEQPVAGKSYLVELRGDELFITDLHGKEPPPDELEILRLNLQAFGKVNPIAAFLNGKVVRVGQSLDVPQEVARELLGLTGNQGDTEQLSMKLVAVKDVHGSRCGVFETLLRTSSREQGSMSLLMKGELTIEESSCRTRAIALRGPVAISEIRGPTGAHFTVSTNGTLKVAVQATYGAATKRR